MEYNYTKQSVNADQLADQIRASSIAVALDYVATNGSALSIFFKAALSQSEQTTLDGLVTAHVPVAIVNDPTKVTVEPLPPMAAKMVEGRNIYRRLVGSRHSLSQNSNTIDYTATFPWAKFIGIEFFGAETGDYCSLEVFDTAAGTYSTIPNYKLDQFGFTANLAKDYYKHKAEFDANLYVGMIIRMTYHSISQKQIGINLILNQVEV